VVAATGRAGAEPPGPEDRRPPSVSAALSERQLQAAVVNGRLRTRLGCSERCALRLELFPTGSGGSETSLTSLRAVVLGPGRRSVTWRLSAHQRRVMRVMLRRARDSGLEADVTAADAAGNLGQHTRTLQ